MVGMASKEDLKSPSLLMRWQVVFPNLAMLPSLVPNPSGISPRPGTVPQGGLDAGSLFWGSLVPWKQPDEAMVCRHLDGVHTYHFDTRTRNNNYPSVNPYC